MNKFKIGDIVRYSYGSTTLMKITGMHGYISPNDGPRYVGIQFYGDSMGAYESDLSLATSEEIIKFKTDNHIGRLRDYPHLAE
jgi:hypothetical protein